MKYLLLLSLFFISGVQAHEEVIPEDPIHPMFRAMRMTHLNQALLDPIQAIKVSPVIVRGFIDSFTPGRDLVRKSGSLRPITMALVKLRVTKVLKGDDVGEFVYFEYIIGGIPISRFNDNKYDKEILVLLREPGWSVDAYNFIDSPEGLMSEVDHLYELTTQRSLIIQKPMKKGKVVHHPLEDEGSDPMFLGQSLDEISAEVEALRDFVGYGFDFRRERLQINLDTRYEHCSSPCPEGQKRNTKVLTLCASGEKCELPCECEKNDA